MQPFGFPFIYVVASLASPCFFGGVSLSAFPKILQVLDSLFDPILEGPIHANRFAETENFRKWPRSLFLMKGRPTPKNTHPNKNSLHKQSAQTISGQFVQIVPPFPFKISRKQTKEFAQTVCANSFYLGGWFFWVGRLPFSFCPSRPDPVRNARVQDGTRTGPDGPHLGTWMGPKHCKTKHMANLDGTN